MKGDVLVLISLSLIRVCPYFFSCTDTLNFPLLHRPFLTRFMGVRMPCACALWHAHGLRTLWIEVSTLNCANLCARTLCVCVCLYTIYTHTHTNRAHIWSYCASSCARMSCACEFQTFDTHTDGARMSLTLNLADGVIVCREGKINDGHQMISLHSFSFLSFLWSNNDFFPWSYLWANDRIFVVDLFSVIIFFSKKKQKTFNHVI